MLAFHWSALIFSETKFSCLSLVQEVQLKAGFYKSPIL